MLRSELGRDLEEAILTGELEEVGTCDMLKPFRCAGRRRHKEWWIMDV
jgi:hypothetical protein